MLKRRDFKVYRFKTKDQTIIYVGYTGKETQERFLEHVKDKYWIHEVAEVEECIIENEGQARLVEMHYINSIKPIFNYKDKFDGAIKSKLRPRDKKFSHCFYVLNGVPTTCVPKTNDGHTLVNFITLEGSHIGIYYDDYLELYYSATDICNLLDVKKKDLSNLANNNEDFIKTSYDYMQKGTDKTGDLYLCNYEGVLELTKLSSSPLASPCKNKITLSRRTADINVVYRDEDEALSAKMLFDEGLRYLSSDRYNDSDTKRRLVYRALNTNRAMGTVVSTYNKEVAVYDFKISAEKLSCDIFALAEDLSNEYGSSYKDVFADFSKYLDEKYEINLWKSINSTKKHSGIDKLPPHFVVALQKDKLYQPFLDFYNMYI